MILFYFLYNIMILTHYNHQNTFNISSAFPISNPKLNFNINFNGSNFLVSENENLSFKSKQSRFKSKNSLNTPNDSNESSHGSSSSRTRDLYRLKDNIFDLSIPYIHESTKNHDIYSNSAYDKDNPSQNLLSAILRLYEYINKSRNIAKPSDQMIDQTPNSVSRTKLKIYNRKGNVNINERAKCKRKYFDFIISSSFRKASNLSTEKSHKMHILASEVYIQSLRAMFESLFKPNTLSVERIEHFLQNNLLNRLDSNFMLSIDENHCYHNYIDILTKFLDKSELNDNPLDSVSLDPLSYNLNRLIEWESKAFIHMKKALKNENIPKEEINNALEMVTTTLNEIINAKKDRNLLYKSMVEFDLKQAWENELKRIRNAIENKEIRCPDEFVRSYIDQFIALSKRYKYSNCGNTSCRFL